MVMHRIQLRLGSVFNMFASTRLWRNCAAAITRLLPAGKGKQNRLLVAAALVLLVIIMLVFGWGGSKQRALSKAVAKLADAETMHAAAELSLSLPANLQNRERPIGAVTIKVNGDVAYQGTTPVLSGKVLTEARGRGMVLYADGDIRLLPDQVAFRLDNLPTLLNPSGNLMEKWTYVPTSTLQTANAANVKTAVANMFQGMAYIGKNEVPGQGVKGYHFRRSVTPQQEDILMNVFAQKVSGNQGLNVLTRLMRAFDVSSFDVWVDPDSEELRLVQLKFRHRTDPAAENRAVLQLALKDYGKRVQIDVPTKELEVRPEIFGRIFGAGKITGL